MITTYKVLDAEGSKFTVKYSTDDGRSTIMQLTWNGKDDVDEWLSLYQPFQPLDLLNIDSSEHIGKTGEAKGYQTQPPTETS